MDIKDLFFVASKIIGFLLEPLHLALALILFSLFLWRIFPKLALNLGGLGLLFFISLGVVPLWQLALQPLENKYPFPEFLPRQVAGIIVLGGAIDVGKVADSRPVSPINSAAERLTEAVKVSQMYPYAPVIFSGLSGSLRDHRQNEADLTRKAIGDLINPKDRIIFEQQSRNSFENAKYTKQLINSVAFKTKYPSVTETFVLITSANHMERSLRVFEAQGINVVPYPVDYRTPANELTWIYDLEIGADLARKFIHEHLGLIAYEWAGFFDPIKPE